SCKAPRRSRRSSPRSWVPPATRSPSRRSTMSANEQAAAAAPAAATTQAAETNLLDQVLAATKVPERSRAEQMVGALIDEAVKGTVTFDKNVTRSIKAGMAAIDRVLSKQLAAIMHNPDFQKLEGTWRGLQYLSKNSETGTQLKIRVFNAKKD